MRGRDVIVIGGSAGSLLPLIEIVQRLPGDLAASVFVVVHIGASTDSSLPQTLAKAGKLPASWARDRQVIEHRHIYVAPPDQHLLLDGDYMRLIRGPKENHTRPAIDPLFRSAALAHGERVVGVLVSGYRDDGCCVQAHAWSPLSLLSELTETREGALQEAARALMQEAELSREIAEKVPALTKASITVGNSGVLAQQARELRAFLATNVPEESGYTSGFAARIAITWGECSNVE